MPANPTPENRAIGRMLQTARESRNILQSELTDATELTKNHISAVERGVSKASVKMLLAYCSKLEMTPNEILGFNQDDNLLPELRAILSCKTLDEQKKILQIIKLIDE